MESRILSGKEAEDILGDTRNALEQESNNGGLLELHDILIARFPDGQLIARADGRPDSRICPLDLIAQQR